MKNTDLLKILFVEDVPSDAELAVLQLRKEKLKFEYTRVDTRDEFIKTLNKFMPDIVISDFKMPSYNGLQALKDAREFDPSMPFILFTGSQNEETAVKCIKAGADDYILKDNLSRLGPAVVNSLNKAELLKQKKNADDALIKSEERYRLLVEKSPDAIAIHQGGKFVFVNSAGVKLIGAKSPQDLIGKPIIDIVHPDSRKKVIDRLQEEKEGKDVPLLEEKFVKLDGSVIDVEVVGIPLPFEGHPASQVIVRDITERKLVEKALLESQHLFQILAQVSPVGIFRTDADGCTTYVNPKWVELSGLSSEKALGTGWFNAVHPEDRKKLSEAWLNNLESRNVSSAEYRFLKPDGSIVWVIGKAVPELNNNKLTGYIGTITDISDRKKGEEELKKNQIQLLNALKLARLGTWEHDWEKNIFIFNDLFYAIFKTTAEQVGGYKMKAEDYVNRFVHPEDRDVVAEATRMANESDQPDLSRQLEHRIIYADGETGYITVRMIIVKDEKGKTIKTYGVNQDITERKKAEESLRQNEEKYRSIFENVQDVYYETSMDGTILEISPSVGPLSQGRYHREDFIGKSMFDFYSDPTERQVLMKALKEKGTVSDYEITLKVGDSSLIRCSISAKISFDANGHPFKIIGSMRDISERKKAEEALKHNLAFSETLLKTIPFGMDIVDEKGTVMFLSDSFKRFFGEGAVGKKCWNLYRDDQKQCIDCPLTRGITAGETEAYESHGVMGNKIFEINHTGMLYQGKKAMLEIFQDISNRKENEEELIKAKEKAEESDRLKTAFLHNISHEIRTPMNAIVGFSALLGEPGIDAQEQQSYIETIMQSSNHLLSIISDIIDISNIEANIVKMARNDINVNSMLNSICNQFSINAGEKKINLICESGLSDPEAMIITDKTKLTQILTNLISNAIKFTDEGTVRLSCRNAGNFLEFSVSDTGIGIPGEYHSRIFERFYQVKDSMSRLYEGTGLGLAISKAYVDLMGGKIGVLSEPGKGTTFTFTIPYERQTVVAEPVIKKRIYEGIAFTEKKTILVAEDVDSNYKLITYFLSNANTKLLRASNGKEAVRMALEEKNIDLILMDIKMPEMDGYEAVRLIREAKIKIPIIAQTAYADDKDKAIENGCNGFITKPFDKKHLINVLCEFI